MHDKNVRHYLGRSRHWLDSHDFNKVVSSIRILENTFNLRTFRFGELPMGYDNQLFNHYVLKRCKHTKKKPGRPWSKNIFGIRTNQNNSMVLTCPPLKNKLTVDARNNQERLRMIDRAIKRDIAAYNTIKPSFKPRLTYQVTDLIVHSPETVAILINQEGMFDNDERAQKHFIHFSQASFQNEEDAH